MRRVFTNLTLDGRRVIARMLQAKMPKTKTEAMLGRDRSPLNGIAPGTILARQCGAAIRISSCLSRSTTPQTLS